MSAVLGFLRARTIYALILLLAVFVVGVEIVRPGTVTPLWASNTILFAAPLAIMAGGQTLVMLTGGIDLSVASVATGAAYLLATNASSGSATAIGLALLVGAHRRPHQRDRRRAPARAAAGHDARHRPHDRRRADRLQPAHDGEPAACPRHHPDARRGTCVRARADRPLPVAHHRRADPVRPATDGFGRLLYAVGDNREACHLAGVRVWRVLFVNYLLCAILAAIAGLVVVGGTNAADLSLADSYLLPSVACVVIGGTSIFGGRGGYAGTIVGALILTVLTGLLTLLDVSEPIKQILYGAIILSLAAAYARLTE